MNGKIFRSGFILLIAVTIMIGIFGCKKERRDTMLILKHVEYEITDVAQLNGLLAHLRETTSRIEGVTLKDIYFVKGKKEFVLFLECESEEKYLEWREICPPPPGAKDWYEILLTKDEQFPK